jgi:hypothetical protein
MKKNSALKWVIRILFVFVLIGGIIVCELHYEKTHTQYWDDIPNTDSLNQKYLIV